MKTIALSDFELNLLHGLLADEEIRLKKAYKILSGHEDIFENTKKYIEEVNKLRKKFTEIDDTEDYFEVADRVEDLWWMQRCLLIPYKTFRDKIRIVNYYERRGYYIEVWDGYIYCYRGK